MMAVSSFVRGEFSIKDERPKTLAAPMYFEFGWQLYNSVHCILETADLVSASYGDGRICK